MAIVWYVRTNTYWLYQKKNDTKKVYYKYAYLIQLENTFCEG